MRRQRKKKSFKKLIASLISIFVLMGIVFGAFLFFNNKSTINTVKKETNKVISKEYTVSEDEKQYLRNRFDQLSSVNSDVVGYLYAPGTMIDEPIVQTTDNETYLEKTFEGEMVPYLGAVFMDMDNSKKFDNQLTWIFGHARGSTVPDHRMFNDVNYYDDQNYFDEHPYIVIETPERKYYYEAEFLIIVPEDTAFYRTEFEDNDDFKKQLKAVYKDAYTKNKDVKISDKDKYIVLSTCREYDETIRSNLYCRLIPDSEMDDFLANHKDELTYQPTR